MVLGIKIVYNMFNKNIKVLYIFQFFNMDHLLNKIIILY